MAEKLLFIGNAYCLTGMDTVEIVPRVNIYELFCTSEGKKIKGFAAHDAVLTGAETRTSAPLRILRDRDTRLASGYFNLFPAGEGAGYAGGITSAAIDGVRSAFALIKIYKNC